MKPRSQPDRVAAEEAEPGPALMTPRRLAAKIQALATEAAALRVRFLMLQVYFEDTNKFFDTIVDGMGDSGNDLVLFAARIAVGEMPLKPSLADDSTWREHRPLLAAIEARNGHAEPEPDTPAAPDGRHWDVFRRDGSNHRFVGTFHGPAGLLRAYERAVQTFPEIANVEYDLLELVKCPRDTEDRDLDIYRDSPPGESLPGHLLVGSVQVPIAAGGSTYADEPPKATGKARGKKAGRNGVKALNGSEGQGGPL